MFASNMKKLSSTIAIDDASDEFSSTRSARSAWTNVAKASHIPLASIFRSAVIGSSATIAI